MEQAPGETPAARGPRRGELIEVEVDSLAYGGRGIARADGLVVFVAGALPGDRVRAEVTKAKKRFAEARTVELLRAGADRLPDVCVHGGEPCPGAPWQGLPYEAQLRIKGEQVDEALRRIGSLDGFELEPIVAAEEQWRYRNKLEYSFGEDGDQPILGFHARGRWDLVVDVDDCHLASAAGNAARNKVRDWAQLESIPAFDSGTKRGVLRNLIVREGRRSGQIQTRLVTAQRSFPKPPVDLHTVVADDSGGNEGPTGVLGEEYLREELCGLKWEISPGAFFQTNTEMAERLYAVAAEYAGLSGSERVFDLFCGIGTIGLSMAGQAGEVWGLEIVPEAIVDAERNAELNGIGNARFVAGNARTGVRPLVEEAGKPDVVVLDPPRAGLSQKMVRRVIECEAAKIVYVSCNPTTLAPNAAQLVEAGYRLTRVRPVDMFPQTPHIECVALFERDQAAVAASEAAASEDAAVSAGEESD
ncbi:MAG TPA: 23S rRNA (uracil(1939)-C(5))-methyltransferase RlmD [Solirubrobacterales bacterium]|jgi:23S rRNA (uracil1939-C5)-methyltransferase|nr:23S rRNA (uracil(1939)-C(5))-methyltransferase RlmD [Solirubrobacterales bacterium]